jgi:hypothetical protein
MIASRFRKGAYVGSVTRPTDADRVACDARGMFDMKRSAPSPSTFVLATVAFAVATLITCIWVAIGVLVIGF